MSLITEAFVALFKVGLPIGILSYAMVRWALHRGYLQETGGVNALRREIKSLARRKDDQGRKVRRSKTDPVHDKWLKFGGGFYGLVALYTYGLVEFREIRDFIANFGGLFEFLRQLNFNMFINLFIDALTNFVTAIAWPVYWMSDISSDRIWLWLLVAYGAYWLAMKLALQSPTR
jgi:hypothetical protein